MSKTSQNGKLKGAALISRARKIAIEAHAGQLDKSGEPYIGHPFRVAKLLEENSAKARATAWLHDVIEDTPMELDHLRAKGIPEDVVDAVDAMSHYKDRETREEYIERVKKNPIAYLVKFADIADNSDKKRLEKLSPERQEHLIKKYKRDLLQLVL